VVALVGQPEFRRQAEAWNSELSGNEVIEAVTCPTCWVAGFRAVMYFEPAQRPPAKAYCPVCGIERQRVASRA
jgi:hypothetical protein